jgi:hypothetical protein
MPDILQDQMLKARLATASQATQKTVEVEIGDTVIEMPEGSPEQMESAIANFRATPEFDSMVDKKSGAPARVRLLVGSAPEQDKLANLKRFYPDAVAYGDGNFVFSDPGSGRPTLFNPSGLDLGDVAGVGREISQAVGGTLGAIAGAGVGGLAGLPTGPGAILTATEGGIIGAGMGTAVGGSLFDASMNLLGGRIDTRTATDTTLEAGADVVTGAVGQRLGGLMESGVKAAVGGGKAAAKALADKFASLGITAPAGAVSGSRTIGTLEKALEMAPGSSDILQKQAETVISQVKTAADGVAARFGAAKTTQGAGETIRQAAVASAERFGFKQEQIYTEAFDMIGAETPVAVRSVTALREEMEATLAQAPGALKGSLTPAINMLKAMEDDAAKNGGGIAFDALRQVRTMIGKDIAAPMLSGSSGAQNAGLKRIYGALTEDLSAAAKATGPEAARKLEAADRFTRFWMNTAAQTMEKINRFAADENAFRFALQSARDGGTALTRMRRHFTEDEWDTVSASVIERLGRAAPGAQDATGEVFSVSTFMTNWNRLAPEAKEALFGGKRYADSRKALDTLVDVVSSLKGVEKLTNTSNTARNMIAFSTINTLGAALGGLAGGDVESAGGGALATLAGSVIAPRYAAKLITNPGFVKWLTTPVTSPGALSAHIGRLSALATAEPEIKEELDQYVAALRSIQ